MGWECTWMGMPLHSHPFTPQSTKTGIGQGLPVCNRAGVGTGSALSGHHSFPRGIGLPATCTELSWDKEEHGVRWEPLPN